ncbi:UDP-N-acetylmuramoyl-tripeptide--D-alanyl-D-alanine ligase [Aliidiomarina sedimenti]|uniref:UDP-N-acetylmuramoyl-tripeptide--D-alanyl-D-alanine ligase n=1 Tax=Aliidiomarina sedimenti TaxID=1933879 RepID=A0ABY0BZG9_9GAMM|nr:UDP-N-acetylmuramoyl-tripeptide--D-alanyl-D-alanine ligase [Aliidiomarina sedimenti]RUO30568.1 UDP-N-acetylmuramoyl-tripeptide--D-alanyl-D-alanine ligase [Aliidiomarina sedimenti]
MIDVDINWVASKVNGHLHGGNADISRVTIDSRDVRRGDLFIAIKGPRFDGHDYAQQAIADGAVAIMTSQQLALDVPQVVVEDTRYALGRLAAAVKAEVDVKTVAMTGSSGKTTVREMCAAILRQRGNVLATQGNFNNDIGVPLTLLNLTHEHEFAVIELGANHRGEIGYTSALVRPDVALINNVQPAHVEGFGDIWGVARAKSEIVKGLAQDGVIYTNADSEFDQFWQREYANRVHKTFAVQNPAADVKASDVELDEQGCAHFTLTCKNQQQAISVPLPGAHNVANALAAAGLCMELGSTLKDVASGIASLKPVPGRMNVYNLRPGLRVIDDTYNANVASAKAALDVLASFTGYRVMVLGDMGELGAHARGYHEEVGTYAIDSGIDSLFTLGGLSQSASQMFNGHGGQHFDNNDALVDALITIMKQKNDVTILVKGSRSARMERIVESIRDYTAKAKVGYSTC